VVVFVSGAELATGASVGSKILLLVLPSTASVSVGPGALTGEVDGEVVGEGVGELVGGAMGELVGGGEGGDGAVARAFMVK